MHNFIKHFVRECYGTWRCTSTAELNLPQGRIQVTPGSVLIRGTKFMNIDLAELLDKQYEIYGQHSR